ncbi:MAG: hypothetical protein AB7J63_04650 [Vicinamibacterales bacterium]
MHGEKFGPNEIVQALRRRRWVVVAVFWCALIGTAVFTRSLPDRFESEVRIQLVPPGFVEQYVPQTVRSKLTDRLPAITERVLDGERLRQIAEQLKPYRTAGSEGPLSDAARIRRDLSIRVVSSDSFSLKFSATDARTAWTVTERLGQAFIDETRRQSETVADSATQFLDSQLADTKRRLEENEQKLAAFNSQHAGELPSQLQSNLQLLQSAQSQLQAVTEALGRDHDEVLAVERMLLEAERAAASASASTPASVRAVEPEDPARLELQAAVQELRDLQARLKPEHPDVIRLKRRIGELQARSTTASTVQTEGSAKTPSVVVAPPTRSRPPYG